LNNWNGTRIILSALSLSPLYCYGSQTTTSDRNN